MESVSRVSLGRAKSCIRRPISILSICFVVVIVVVIIAEYFIVHSIDENNMTSDTTSTQKAAAPATTTTTTAATTTTTKATTKSAVTTTTETTVDILKIPDSWILASATSAYQVEGAWNVSDKGESIWDYYTHTYPSRVGYATGDDACKSYEFYKTDVQMLVQTGFNAYRFSVSWPRVLPNGTADYISDDGIAYYNNLINELLAYNITPLVTLYHWDLPQVLQDEYNGWLNTSIADLFADYANVLFENYGDRVKYWITFNEPNLVVDGYTGTLWAPGYEGTTGVSDYIANHNILRAHGKAYQVYNNTYRATQNGSIGMTYSITGIFPANESSYEDREAALREWEFTVGLYANAIYSPGGNYPSIVRERVDNFSYYEGLNNSRLPHFTDEELDELAGLIPEKQGYELRRGSVMSTCQGWILGVTSMVDGQSEDTKSTIEAYRSARQGTVNYGTLGGRDRGSYDFFGINHYSSEYVTSASGSDSGVTSTSSSTSGEGLRNVINWVKKMYGAPTLITENGCSSELGLNDTDRITLYHSMIKGVLEAYYEDGCDVIGYTAWSLMDNMEWFRAYTSKYGIWQVDFDDVNRTRTMKDSAYWFQELLSTRRLPNATTTS